MMEPLVTVITPTYNCASFLGETIESVLSQNYRNIEYLVLDDGSADNTGAVLGKYAGRIKAVRHDNMGEQATVNKALDMVRGDYFMIVNSDDPLLPGAVSTLVSFMESHPDVLCGYPDWISINEDGSARSRMKAREYDYVFMVRHHFCLPSVGSIFRREVIEKVGCRDAFFRYASDFDYWLRIGLEGNMARVPATLATWRNRGGQASNDKNRERAAERPIMMMKYYSLPRIPPEIAAVRREAFSWAYLVAAAISSDKIDVLKYVARALMVYPRQLLTFEFWYCLYKYARYILRK